MYNKIYSRRRFIIKPRFKSKMPNSNKWNLKKKRKILKILTIIVLAIIIYRALISYINPVFEALCDEKVKAEATIITNQQSTIFMNKYQYNDLYTIEKDGEGNITLIKANVVPINNMISDLTENIQHEFNKIEEDKIHIPIGSLAGNYFFAGSGPEIPIKVLIEGTLDTEVKSEFIAQGINQTIHRTYVEFICDMKILTPIKNYSKSITNQVMVAEHVILGQIPDTYYNLDGFDSPKDTLDTLN